MSTQYDIALDHDALALDCYISQSHKKTPIFHLICTTTTFIGFRLLYQSLFQDAKQRKCKSWIDGYTYFSPQPPWPSHYNHPLHLHAPLSCLVFLVQSFFTTPITQEARLLMNFWNNVLSSLSENYRIWGQNPTTITQIPRPGLSSPLYGFWTNLIICRFKGQDVGPKVVQAMCCDFWQHCSCHLLSTAHQDPGLKLVGHAFAIA